MALPGQTFTNGVSNYIFGTNTPNYNTALITNTNVQTQMATAGITVIRTSLNDNNNVNYTDAQIDATYNAIHTSGAVMLAILRRSDLTFAQHCVSYLGSRCLLYEFGNEPDLNGVSYQTYLSLWNQLIPACRAINPSAAYGGPVLGDFANVGNYLIPWLQGCKSSSVLPDFISYHVYPCTSTTRIPQATCSAKAPNIGLNGAQLRTQCAAILGYSPAIACTEWNADAWYSNPTTGSQPAQGYNSNSSTNDAFNHQFAIDALNGFVSNQIDMACQFELNYFLANPSGPTSSTAQYTAMESEEQLYLGGGGGTTTGLTVSQSSFSFSAPVNGQTQQESFTLTNASSSSVSISASITYSAYGNLNWAGAGAASDTIAANSSEAAYVIVTPQIGMPVGTYTATITLTTGGSATVTLTVTLTLTAPTVTSSRIYVPTNAYPTDPGGSGTTWAQYEAGAPAVSLAIVNPSNGPGASADSNFTTGIAAMQTAGIKVLGYISSSDGVSTVVPQNTVQSQIDTWYSLYSIDGIALDDTLATSANAPYYQALYAYIKSKSATQNLVFLNVETVPPETYLAYADTVNVFQDVLGNIGLFQPPSYLFNYPASKLAAMVMGVSNTASVDSTVAALQAANVGYIFVTDQTTESAALTTPPSSTIWNELITDSHVGGGSSGGTTATALALYFSSAAATTITSADRLYTTSGSPSVTWKYNRVGTGTGYGEITSQGTTGAWAAATSIPSPTGKGFLLDATTLESQQIVAGTWSAAVRLNCAQNGDSAPQAGALTADIIVRAFKRSSGGTYTPIVSMTLGAQSLTFNFTTFTLPATSASAMSFTTGDKVYLDIWLNVTANGNASSVQDVRLNHLSTDTGGHTGDPAATVGTPGYASSSGSATTPFVASPTSLAISGLQGGGVTTAQNVTLTTDSSTSGTWSTGITYYGSGYGWLQTNISSASISTSSTATVAVSANTAGLAPGTYSAALVFVLGIVSQTVLVALTVEATQPTTLPVALTLAGKSLIAAGWAGTDNPRITYLAVGTGTAAPTPQDMSLQNETFRKLIASTAPGLNPGELLVNGYLSSTDVVGQTITEFGLFAGSAATAKTGTGILVARGLYTITSKTSLESVQLQFDLQVQ